MHRLKGTQAERAFLDEVMERSGQNLLECLQCGKCSGSCPITSSEVGGPRRLIAQILSGMKPEALRDPTWWYCVSCGTCANRCPVEINMYQVSTVLCEMAHEEGVKPSEPAIHLFEDLFLKSVEKYGRVHELRTVMIYNLRRWNPLKDMSKGVRLMIKGAISPKEMIESRKRDERVARIFANVDKIRHGDWV